MERSAARGGAGDRTPGPGPTPIRRCPHETVPRLARHDQLDARRNASDPSAPAETALIGAVFAGVRPETAGIAPIPQATGPARSRPGVERLATTSGLRARPGTRIPGCGPDFARLPDSRRHLRPALTWWSSRPRRTHQAPRLPAVPTVLRCRRRLRSSGDRGTIERSGRAAPSTARFGGGHENGTAAGELLRSRLDHSCSSSGECGDHLITGTAAGSPAPPGEDGCTAAGGGDPAPRRRPSSRYRLAEPGVSRRTPRRSWRSPRAAAAPRRRSSRRRRCRAGRG